MSKFYYAYVAGRSPWAMVLNQDDEVIVDFLTWDTAQALAIDWNYRIGGETQYDDKAA
jgi:hypothetical protein